VQRSLSPAWKRIPELIPRSTHQAYLTHLEIMDRKAARHFWRESIKACWDHRCAFCNGVPIADESLTLDHVKPRSRGGQDLTSNIVPACATCNSNKASSDWRSWFQLQSFYCPVREAEIQAWMTTGDRHVEDWWEIGVGALEACVGAIEIRAQRQPPAPAK
jgi:hypothetical protein